MLDMTKETNRFFNMAVLALGIVTVIANFLPIATYGGYYETIPNIGSFAYLLFLIPFFAIGPAIVALYGKIYNEGVWYIIVGIIGMVLSIAAITVGENNLKAFILFVSNSNLKDVYPTEGSGATLLLFCYLIMSFIGYSFIIQNKRLKFRTNSNTDIQTI